MRILVLGSLPGQRSIDANQYYAHPRNAFWKIMEELLGVAGHYEARCEQLASRGIALWDVLKGSVRPGSLDADIRMDTVEVNDFNGFFQKNPGIERIGFNGRKAETLYRRLVQPGLPATRHFVYVPLPSTSPAYAGMPYAEKLERWRALVES